MSRMTLPALPSSIAARDREGPRLWHERGPGQDEAVARPRREGLLFLLRRLPREVPPGAREVSFGRRSKADGARRRRSRVHVPDRPRDRTALTRLVSDLRNGARTTNDLA